MIIVIICNLVCVSCVINKLFVCLRVELLEFSARVADLMLLLLFPNAKSRLVFYSSGVCRLLEWTRARSLIVLRELHLRARVPFDNLVSLQHRKWHPSQNAARTHLPVNLSSTSQLGI